MCSSILLLTACTVGNAQETGVIQEEWLSRARKELRGAIQAIHDVGRGLDEEATYRFEGLPGLGKTAYRNRTVRRRCSQVDRNALSESITTFDDRPERPEFRLECWNEAYHFLLRRDRADTPYVLVQYGRRVGEDQTPWMLGGVAIVFDALPSLLGAVEGRENCKLLSLMWIDRENALQAMVEVRRGVGTRVSTLIHDVLIESQFNWRVRRYRLTSPQTSIEAAVQYGDSINGISLPVEYRAIEKPTNGEPFSTHAVFRNARSTKTADDFKLPAFSFPEPVDVPKAARLPRYWWFFIGGGLCLIAGIALRYAHQRKSRRRL